MDKLLDRLIHISAQMQLMFEKDEIEQFYKLLEERKRLVRDISTMTEKNGSMASHSEKFARVDKQFKSLMRALRKKEQLMMSELQQLQNLKHAHHSYHIDRQPRRILNRNLTG